MGTALTATLLRTGWHSSPGGTALGSAAPGWERMHTPLWQFHRWKSWGRCGVSPSVLPLLSLAPKQATLLLFLQLVHLGIVGSLWEGHLCQAQCPICRTPGSFQLGSHSALFKRPYLHSLFLWLKGRNVGERTVPTSVSIPLRWRWGWHCPACRPPLG